MNDAKARAEARLRGLINMGDPLTRAGYRRPQHQDVPGYRRPDAAQSVWLGSREALARFQAQAKACLIDLVGPDHSYFQSFEAASTGRSGSEQREAQEQLGVLKAVLDDVRSGYLLETTRVLVAAHLFSDLMEQAEHLLQAGYHIPAASLCGGVLESSLREFAWSKGVSVRDNDDISTLNQKCHDKQLITLLQRKQVEVWAGVRNLADHGRYAEVEAENVKKMLAEVRAFMSETLQIPR